MQLNRIYTSKNSRYKLSKLKSQTGLLPNILCRIGILLSFSEPTIPNIDINTMDGSELHRDTLFGEWDLLIIALLEEWCITKDISIDNDSLVKYLHAHLNRGIHLLYIRTKELKDLVNIKKV